MQDQCGENKMNTLLITMDQLIAYHNLPTYITDQLPGYQAFKKIGIEFTNIHNNRQMCSPSRSSFMTSTINTAIQDNIEEAYQFGKVPFLNENLDTLGKSFLRNGYEYTAYFGKNHIDARLTRQYIETPVFSLNSRDSMRAYGYTQFNLLGDTSMKIGYNGDNQEFEYLLNPNSAYWDYIDHEGRKFEGILPFLKSRFLDKKPFHAEYHMIQPHDTQEFYQNPNQTPSTVMMQYKFPFLEEQTEDIDDPFFYNSDFPDAYIKDENFVANYFEHTYKNYKNNKRSLPFLPGYELDYVTDPKVNNIFPMFAGFQNILSLLFTMPENKKDIKAWKNLINNYYALLIQSDMYLFKIYQFLETTGMLANTSIIITADHGDMMSDKGLKQKGLPFRNCVNVPFIVCSPYLSPLLRGTKSTRLGSLLDLNPTMETLANIRHSKEFMGESLLSWYDGEIVVNECRQTRSVFQICCSTMIFPTSYVGFITWYQNATQEQKDKVKNVPSDIFNFQYAYVMTIKEYKGEQYKFCRYYSLYTLLVYNFLQNPKLTNKMFTSSELLSFLSGDLAFTNNGIKTAFATTLSGSFNFINGYVLTQSNPYLNYLYVVTTSIYADQVLNSNYIIPGSNNTYDQLKYDPGYTFMCWNMTKDNDEIVDLVKLKFDDTKYNKLFTSLNNTLNADIVQYKLAPCKILVPNAAFLSLLNIMIIYGTDFNSYSPVQLKTFSTLLGLDNFDSEISYKSMFEMVTETLRNSGGQIGVVI